MTTKILTPAGRIVWGNPLESRGKVKNGQPVIKDGKQVQEFSFGLAIPKVEFGPFGAAMQAEAQAIYPQGVPANFSFKVKDGDTGVDRNNNPLNQKPGYAGCYVIALSTEYPIAVFKREAQGFVQLTQGVKTGDFARAEVTINGHAADPKVMGSKGGVYLNPNMVEFLGYGEEIRGAVNPEAAFGAAPAALPPGASATPVASGPPPSFGGAPQVQAPSPPAPPPAAPNTQFPWGS